MENMGDDWHQSSFEGRSS